MEETSTQTSIQEPPLKFIAVLKSAREYVVQGVKGGVVPSQLNGSYSNAFRAERAIESYYATKNAPKRGYRKSKLVKKGVSSGGSKKKS